MDELTSFTQLQRFLEERGGLRVSRTHLRGPRFFVELRTADKQMPFLLIRLDDVAAVIDTGLGNRILSRATLTPAGAFGADVAGTLKRPEIAGWLELRLWSSDDPNTRLRGLSRTVTVLQGNIEGAV